MPPAANGEIRPAHSHSGRAPCPGNLLPPSRPWRPGRSGSSPCWAHAFSRAWEPEDWIIPQLDPEPGVTHVLGDVEKIDESTYRGRPGRRDTCWAAGGWNVAMGIWRVPSFSAYTCHRWVAGELIVLGRARRSSPYGSKDVLQAGVQQAVAANGATRYVAGLSGTRNSKIRPIASIRPTSTTSGWAGGPAFSSVRYVNGTGQILQNITTGQVFAISHWLPTAAMNGDSAEWIVEAPTRASPIRASTVHPSPIHHCRCRWT